MFILAEKTCPSPLCIVSKCVKRVQHTLILRELTRAMCFPGCCALPGGRGPDWSELHCHLRAALEDPVVPALELQEYEDL